MFEYFVPYYQRPRDTVNTVRLGTMSLGVGLFHDLAYRWIHQLRLGLAVRVRLCTGTLKSTVYCRAEFPYYLFMVLAGMNDMLKSTSMCCFSLHLDRCKYRASSTEIAEKKRKLLCRNSLRVWKPLVNVCALEFKSTLLMQ